MSGFLTVREFVLRYRYVEPPAAVPLNNDLAAARGEMFAAEEAVLWKLTSSVVDAVETIQETLGKVSM